MLDYQSIINDFVLKRRPNCVVAPHIGRKFTGFAIIGEAPSTAEIEQHAPFVGPSGMILMTAMHFNALTREDVALDNICPVGLPHKHTLKVGEIDILRQGLFSRLRDLNTTTVLACGLSAIKAFLPKIPGALEGFRGRVFDCDLGGGHIVKVIPTFHPAVLLKPQDWLGLFWYIVYDMGCALKVFRGEEPYDVNFEGSFVFSRTDLEEWLENADEVITFDFEATEKNPFLSTPYCVSMSCDDYYGICVPLKFVDPRAKLELSEVIELLRQYKKRIVVHNAFYDIALIRKYGLEPPPFYDTMYQFHNIAEFMPKGLKDLGSFFCKVPVYSFNFKKINRLKDLLLSGDTWDEEYKCAFDIFYKYAIADAITTYRVYKTVTSLAEKDKRGRRLYKEFTHKLIEELIEVSRAGVYFDRELADRVGLRMMEEMKTLESRVKKIISIDNLNSTKQLAPHVKRACESLGLRVPMTNKGQVSTAASVLEQLASRGVEFAKFILEYRKRKKLMSTYIESFSRYLDGESRVHTSFSLAETMRLKSAEPALQVIPRDSVILSLFSVKRFKDRILGKVDYSSAEARVFAWYSNEKKLLDPTLDIHKLVASFFFKVPVEKVSSEMRQAVKTIFFGKIYGSGLGLLAKQLNCSIEEAKQKESDFFETLPGFKAKMDEWRDSVVKHGKIETRFGVKRTFLFHRTIYSLFPKSSIGDQFFHAAIREGYNTPSQSTVAYLTNRSLILLNKAFRKKALRSRIVLQWHDALIFEIFKSEVWEVLSLIYKIMRMPLVAGDDFFVPIDICVGFDLLDQYKILKFYEQANSVDEMKALAFQKELPPDVKAFLK